MHNSEENEVLNRENRQLGRYRLKELLARGGMAEVYLGTTEGAHGFEKNVAIKRILPKFAEERQFINMMVDEAKIMVLLNHPNIAQVIEFGQQENELFIVMEYVEGHALSTLLKAMRSAEEQCDQLATCYILSQTLRGLHAAHVQTRVDGTPAEIIHRDVSPQNILITYDGHIKLVDFGVAKAADRLEQTKQGTIKGKLRYLAPEIIEPQTYGDGPADGRVDVFSAGVILYEMLAGKKLFQGKGAIEIYDSILNSTIPDLRERGVEDELWAIVSKALQRKAADRYATAAEFANELQAFIYRRDPGYESARIAELMERYQDKLRSKRTGTSQDVSDRLKQVSLQKTSLWPADDSTAVGSRSRHTPSSQIETLKVKPDQSAQSVRSEDMSWTIAPELETRVFDAEVHTQTLMPSIEVLDAAADLEEKTPSQSKRMLILMLALLIALGGLTVMNRMNTDKVSGDSTTPMVAVNVRTDPAGVQFKMSEGEIPRLTPSTVIIKAGQPHKFILQKEGFEDIVHEQTFDGRLEHEQLNFKMKPLPISLQVSNLPPDAVVLWNGQAMKNGRITAQPGAQGVLEIRGPSIETLVEQKTFSMDMSKVYIPTLSYKEMAPEAKPEREDTSEKKKPAVRGFGKLSIRSKPYLAEVWIDGKKHPESTPLRTQLRAGKHKLVLKVPSKNILKRQTVEIQKGKTTSITVDLD